MSDDVSERQRPELSPREKQLLQMAAKGYTDNAISNRLGISLATVGTYWGRIRIKYGPLNRTELVAVALKEESASTVAILKSENQKLLEELDSHAKTAAILRSSLELFRGLVETAPDAIILVNQDGEIQLANEQAQQLFGYSEEELLGIGVERLVPDRYRETHVEHRSVYNSDPVKRRMGEHLATWALKKDGSEFAMATALSASQTPNGLLITCIIRDLSE